MTDEGLAAVWRPGGGTQWWRSGMTADEFAAQDGVYFGQGLRIRCLSIRNGRFAAVWQPGDGTQWVQWGLTAEAFAAQDQAYFAQGLRLTALEIDNGWFAGVWRPGEGTQWVRWGMSVADLEAQDREYFPQGLRITSLEVDQGWFAAVWRPGEGTQWWRAGMTGAEFEAQDATYFADGLRIAALAIEGDRYAAVWQPGEGTQWCSHRRGVVDLMTEDSTYFGQGLRLTTLEVHDQGWGAYHYPWTSGVSFVCNQGNNNPGGSHNGVQAFAFDFGLPAGTTVRAARGGVVEWLQETQTATFDPSAPVSPTNQPFPNGDLRNWGNAVRIRHLGGFTSWYFHLQADSVSVNVGDVVEAGQPIALSGNTGRSSGAHLHFQVQADSVDWGQTVAISLGDCEVPTGGTTVTSDNANPRFP